jgi:hypothetical protein
MNAKYYGLRSQWLHIHKKEGWFYASDRHSKRFPFNNFTYCLTLFSKFFSSFPHGTCSLSVSRQYSALDETYHPFWAAFPNNPTRWKRITKVERLESKTGFSPSMIPCSKGVLPKFLRKTLLHSTILSGEPHRFQIWALPASLAVTRGILVSFFSSAYWYA